MKTGVASSAVPRTTSTPDNAGVAKHLVGLDRRKASNEVPARERAHAATKTRRVTSAACRVAHDDRWRPAAVGSAEHQRDTLHGRELLCAAMARSRERILTSYLAGGEGAWNAPTGVVSNSSKTRQEVEMPPREPEASG